MCFSTFDLVFSHDDDDVVLEQGMVGEIRAWLVARFGQPSFVDDCWESYGAEFESRLDLLWDEVDECQLHVHLDVDTEVYTLVLELCSLAKLVGCQLYSPEFEVAIPPIPSVVVHRLTRSHAWQESWAPLDPMRVLEKASPRADVTVPADRPTQGISTLDGEGRDHQRGSGKLDAPGHKARPWWRRLTSGGSYATEMPPGSGTTYSA